MFKNSQSICNSRSNGDSHESSNLKWFVKTLLDNCVQFHRYPKRSHLRGGKRFVRSFNGLSTVRLSSGVVCVVCIVCIL